MGRITELTLASQARFDEFWFTLSPQNRFIGAKLITPRDGVKASSTLHLVDRKKHFDLATLVKKKNLCEDFKSGVRMGTLNFWNLYWTNPLGDNPQLNGLLMFECQTATGNWVTRIGDQITISPQLEIENKQFLFSTKSVNIKVMPCEQEGVDECNKTKELFYKNKK